MENIGGKPPVRVEDLTVEEVAGFVEALPPVCGLCEGVVRRADCSHYAKPFIGARKDAPDVYWAIVEMPDGGRFYQGPFDFRDEPCGCVVKADCVRLLARTKAVDLSLELLALSARDVAESLVKKLINGMREIGVEADAVVMRPNETPAQAFERAKRERAGDEHPWNPSNVKLTTGLFGVDEHGKA